MVKEIIKDMKEVIVERLTVPHNLTKKQYYDLKSDYTDMIVKSKVQLQKCFAIYKEQLAEVLSFRRKLNDAENRLIEVYDRIEKARK